MMGSGHPRRTPKLRDISMLQLTNLVSKCGQSFTNKVSDHILLEKMASVIQIMPAYE